MTGAELKRIRERMELEPQQFAIHVIGYTGADKNIDYRVRKMEAAEEVPLHIARLVWLTLQYSMEHNGNMPHWPDNLSLEGETPPWM
jgi:hypothetical protein